MIDSIDFAQLPIWAGVLLLILNFLRTPLSKLFPFLKAKAVAKAEIEEIVAEGRRQDEVTEKLMLARLVGESLNLNRESTDFIRAIIVARLDIMDARLDAIGERLISISSEQKNLWRQYEKVVNGE